MEENNVTTGKISIRYGLISGLAAIALFVVMDLMGQGTNQYLQWIGYLVMAAIMYMAHKAYKEEGDGFMNYGQGLGIGTLMALISSAISSAFFFVYVSYINTGFIQQMLDMQREKMEESGVTGSQLDNAMEMTEKFMTPTMMLIFGIVGTVFFGFILSLIVSAITQKKRPENNLV